MDLKDIRQLIKMLEGTDISEFELTEENRKLRIARAVAREEPLPVMAYAQPPMMMAPQQPALYQASAPQAAAADSARERDGVSVQGGVTVTSPMVGTFYRSPSPDARAFVEEGDVVKKGQVVCIIEAMKLMNEIESDVSGRVVKILVENASPVEYGAELFLIDPAL